MVIKWSTDVDHILLLKILEVHDVHVDTKAIADKWPADREKPTPRAISERLVKLRSLVKKGSNGSGHFAITGRAHNTVTPKTSHSPKTPTSIKKNRATVTGSASARKKAVKSEDILNSTELPVDDEGGFNIKTEPTDHATPGPSSLPTPTQTETNEVQTMDGAHDMPTTPTPTRRMLTRGHRVRTYASEEAKDESDDESDISDFHDGRDGGMSPDSTVNGDDEMDGI